MNLIVKLKYVALTMRCCVNIIYLDHTKGFLHHVKEDHNKWNYVYYSLYLDSIDTSNHNAIQQYVYALVINAQTQHAQ